LTGCSCLCLLLLTGEGCWLPGAAAGGQHKAAVACACCRMAGCWLLASFRPGCGCGVLAGGGDVDATLVMSAQKKENCREEKFLWDRDLIF